MNENEIKTEIDALIAEADSDLEMVNISQDTIAKETAAKEHGIYVQALKDLAERLGVKLG